MAVDFKGYDERIVTFNAATASVSADKIVRISAKNTVALANGGEAFVGVVKSRSGSTAAVQIGGYTELTYSGSAPALGRGYLVASGMTSVMTAPTVGQGAPVIIVSVDTATSTIGCILL